MQNNPNLEIIKPTVDENVQLEPLKDVAETGDKNENVPIISDGLDSEEIDPKFVENVMSLILMLLKIFKI